MPFTTKNAEVCAERVIELINVNQDNMNEMDGELSAEEDEPRPGARDEKMPNQAVVYTKPPPIVVQPMKAMPDLDKLIHTAKPTSKRRSGATPKHRSSINKPM